MRSVRVYLGLLACDDLVGVQASISIVPAAWCDVLLSDSLVIRGNLMRGTQTIFAVEI